MRLHHNELLRAANSRQGRRGGKRHDIFHVVNNAYGLQCGKITNDLNQAHKQGKLDVLISSTDKNFMVPVTSLLLGANID